MKPTDNLVADTICRTVGIGLAITGVTDAGTVTIIDAASVVVSSTCPECGHSEKLHDHIPRQLVDLPVVSFPNRLDVRVPRFLYTVTSCPKKIFQTSLACTDDGSKLTHRVTRRILQRLAIDRMSISATAKTPGIGWNLINQVALNAYRQLVYDGPHHLDGVHILGVDEHVWKHTQEPGQPSSLATILVDLTPLVDRRGSARLLDLRPGRSAEMLRAWLQERDPNFRSQVQAVTTDDFTGCTSAVDQVLPDTTKVMDPFRVVRLVADKLTGCRQRLQRETTGQCGRRDDPLYKYHRTLLTRTSYLTQRQKQRLDLLWATDDDYVTFEVTWLFCQDMITACGHPKRSEGKKLMSRVINNLHKGLPAGLEEFAQLGRALRRRCEDVLAYFDIGVSNGPVESINDRLEYLRGIALGFRDLNHYILRCLIHSGQLQGKINTLWKRKSLSGSSDFGVRSGVKKATVGSVGHHNI